MTQHTVTPTKVGIQKNWAPIFIGVAIFLFMTPAHAAETHALTMHGVPALAADFTHYPYANPDAPKGGVLKQAALGTFDTLNPFTIKGKAPMGLYPGTILIYDRLMDRSWDEPFTLYPLIARSVDVPDDRSSITFDIDPRAHFADGSPVTPTDVKFSFETLRDLGRPNMRRVYKLVASVDLIGGTKIKFTLAPDHDRETVMILALMPVLSKADWTGKNFDAATLTPPLGNGPYKIKSVDPGRRVIYERDPNYWARDLPTRKGQFNFDQIIYDYFRDDTVAFEAFKSGNLNFRRELNVKKWASVYDFPRLLDGTVHADAFKHGRAEMVRGFVMNTRRAPFDDLRVRQALSLAFDFDWVNKTLFAGKLSRTTSFFPNTDLSYTAPADPRSVREKMLAADHLLKQAGWIIRDGQRVNAETGAPFTFDIITNAREYEKIVLSYTRSLQKLGIRATSRTLDAAAFQGRVMDYDMDMMFYDWQSTLSPGAEQAQFWGCQAANTPGRFNYAGVCDPAIEALIQKIPQTRTRDDLRAETQTLDHLLQTGAYVIPFGYNPSDLIAYDKNLNHPNYTPLNWFIPETWWTTPAKPIAETKKP